MGRSERDKGKRFEREIAGFFKDWGFKTRRGQQYSGLGGEDVVGLPGIHIECKAVEKLNIYEAMSQSIRDAAGKVIPIVIHKRNNHKRLVTMLLDDWIHLYRAYYEELPEEVRDAAERMDQDTSKAD